MEENTKGRLEKILGELGVKLDQLMEDAKEATGGVREEVDDHINDLKDLGRKMENEYKEYKAGNEGKWDEVKKHISTAAMEVEQAVKTAFRKKK